ncbi:MAG: T9SS type A sorting domain-containing protein [Taibaiella sp.]|nr:T9SS type A sorting domain-containing protein [Taibaiella sp.]
MKKIKLITLIAAISLSFTNNANAQLDSCNVFLKGNYVEVGINANGAYGSSVGAPTGYHPLGASPVDNSSICGTTPTTRNLGFVADPDKDGWTTGSPYPYIGDYFMPGDPQEGWSIMADGHQVNAWNGFGTASSGHIMDSNITGSNISYTTIGAKHIGIWQGYYDSIQITQITVLDTTKAYFTVHVALKNFSHTAKHNVYYMRTIDPDNTEPESGSFTTANKIAYQLPNPGNKVMVTAKGLSDSLLPVHNGELSLGTVDSMAKCFIVRNSLAPDSTTLDSLYAKYGGKGDTVREIYSGSDTRDEGMGLVFKIGTLPSIDSAVFAYAYIFGNSDVDSALASTAIPFYRYTQPSSVLNTTLERAKVNAYPNPFNNELTIANLESTDKLTLYDVMGKAITQNWIAGNGTNIFHTGNLPAGVYILVVTDKSGTAVSRMPLQKL